jgi:hypothetical protein
MLQASQRTFAELRNDKTEGRTFQYYTAHTDCTTDELQLVLLTYNESSHIFILYTVLWLLIPQRNWKAFRRKWSLRNKSTIHASA